MRKPVLSILPNCIASPPWRFNGKARAATIPSISTIVRTAESCGILMSP
jgi:hypothetical protein